DFAHQIGYPIIVKPNSGSHGNGVFMVYNQKELQQALDYIFPKDNIALIQKFITGNDYRIVVLDDKIISAYQRLPFCIVGDAKNDIERLIVKKIKTLADLNRPVNIKISDQRILQNLKRQKLNLKSVLKKDEKIYLLNNANLSSGGDALDITNIIHPEFKKLAIQLTRDMGLRLCGVDLMVQGEISEKIKKYWIIEINSSPGLDHYLKIGKNQEKIVENMYLEVLKALGKY
ncbi:MAG: ATP-grasp domain-containing protein, partial [Bacteroidia bacterium]